MHTQVQGMHPAASRAILLDLPGLLFFSTYTLLVLFWAEIYHQARSLPTGSLRPAFLGLNAAVYAVQARCPRPSGARPWCCGARTRCETRGSMQTAALCLPGAPMHSVHRSCTTAIC